MAGVAVQETRSRLESQLLNAKATGDFFDAPGR